jgi:hypothetical protein
MSLSKKSFNPDTLKCLALRSVASVITKNKCPKFPDILDDPEWAALRVYLRQCSSDERREFREAMATLPECLNPDITNSLHWFFKQIFANLCVVMITDTSDKYVKIPDPDGCFWEWFKRHYPKSISVFNDSQTNEIKVRPDIEVMNLVTIFVNPELKIDLENILQWLTKVTCLKLDLKMDGIGNDDIRAMFGAKWEDVSSIDIHNSSTLLDTTSLFKDGLNLTKIIVNFEQIGSFNQFQFPPNLKCLEIRARHCEKKAKHVDDILLWKDLDPNKVLCSNLYDYKGPISTNLDILAAAFPALKYLNITKVEAGCSYVNGLKTFQAMELVTMPSIGISGLEYYEEHSIITTVQNLSPKIPDPYADPYDDMEFLLYHPGIGAQFENPGRRINANFCNIL